MRRYQLLFFPLNTSDDEKRPGGPGAGLPSAAQPTRTDPMGMRFAVLVLSFSGALSQCTTSYYTNVVSACDLLNSSNTDVTRFCSGACNTALNTASNGCSASVTSEASIKQTADNSLSYCSGCMFMLFMLFMQ